MVLSKQPSIVGFVNWIGEIPFLIEHVLAQDIMFYPLLNEFSIFPQIFFKKKSFKKLKNFRLTNTILPKFLMFTLIVLIIYHNFWKNIFLGN